MVAGASSLAGLAELMRSDRDITVREVASSLLNSGILGGAVFAVWWNYGGETNPVFVAGVCVLAGLGGTAMVEFGVALLKRLAIKFFKRGPDEKS